MAFESKENDLVTTNSLYFVCVYLSAGFGLAGERNFVFLSKTSVVTIFQHSILQ